MDWHRDERAIALESPAVIHAHEPLSVAGPVRTYERAFVRTAVLEHIDLAVTVAHHNHRLAPHLCREVVTPLRNLAFVPDIIPGPTEDAIHFQLEHCRVCEHPAVNAFRLDEAINL
jgi:hypothetical protein